MQKDTGVNSNLQDSGKTFFLFSILVIVSIFLLVLIPLVEALGRKTTGFGIPGAANWVQHLTLWIGLFGAILTSIKKQHLTVAALTALKIKKDISSIKYFNSISTIIVLIFLALASYNLVKFQMDSPEKLGSWFPVWLAQAVMPVSFIFMAIIALKNASDVLRNRLILFTISILFVLLFVIFPDFCRTFLFYPAIIFFLIASFLGMPIFTVLSGIGLLLFFSAEIPIAALPLESYRILTQPILPSIPLFALAGSILAAGGAPRRLIGFIDAWTCWFPGGAAFATIAGCALFTAITGASGVTILALGGLLLPVLVSADLKEKFGIGLLTSSGSVGLLFPPSLPVILYGVYGHVAIDQLFIAAFIPGLLLIFLLFLFSLYKSNPKMSHKNFELNKAVQSLWHAKGDLVLPILIIIGIFGGFLTIVETAALTALWAILLETVFHRELKFFKHLPKVLVEASVLIGALLIVLGLASGLVSYMVDAQVHLTVTDWVLSVIKSKLLFLLILNVILLLIGALMDIFSAIVIVVPLIVPIGVAFGIDPVHLGIIFLANLELGYLTPPIGMNLFLSSLRFKRPLLEIWKTVLPFLIIFIIWVLLITYVPQLSLGLGKLLGQ